MGTPADSAVARQRLLDAACEVFADFGYQHATVRMICARAQLNLGAVNYHFGSKRDLYAEVLRRAQPAVEPLPRANGDIASREQQLRRFIAFFLAETLDNDRPPWTARVLANELANPSDLLDGLVREAIVPHFDRLRDTIAGLLGTDADNQTVDDHAFSVVAQVVFYRNSRPIIERVAEREYGRADMERLSDHIFDAVLAGLRQQRRHLAEATSLNADGHRDERRTSESVPEEERQSMKRGAQRA